VVAETKTGGRPATDAVIGGGLAIAVGKPKVPTPAGFVWRPLTELARLETGHTPSRAHPEYWDGDIPWIGIRDATGNHGRTIDTTLQTVTQEGIHNSSARVLPAGTVCLSRTASVGYVVVMGVPMATSQDFVNWVCGPELDPQYLKYVLQADREALLRFANGSTHQTIYFPEAKALHALLPHVEAQRSIVATLGALDAKIESNARAAAIELDLAIALLAHGSERVAVGDVAEVSKGLSYKGSGLDDGSSLGARPMVNLANFTTSGALKIDRLKFYTGDFKPKHRLAAWDLVVANTDLTQAREILGRGFLVPPTLDGALHTHHTTAIRFRKRPDLALVLWAQLQQPEFRDRAKGFATGTTVTALPPEAILEYEFAVPSDHKPSVTTARRLIEHSWQLGTESAALAATRDAVLPDLLSGRVRVSEAASVVQDAME